MKKLFFACIGLLFANIANAQFKATKDGIKTDDGNDFYVVSIDGKSAKELFRNSAKRIYLFEIKRVRRIASFSGNE